MVHVVPLRYDTAFKKAFSQVEVFCQFVHDVLGIDIQIDKVHRAHRYLKEVSQVDIEYDLFAEDEDARILVEIQHVKERDVFDRFLYYHLIGIVEQVKSSRNYHIDKTVYTIVVMTSSSLDKGIDCSVLMGDFSFVNEFRQKVALYSHQLVFLVPRLVNDETPSGIKAWLELIVDSLDDAVDETRYPSPIFQLVIDAIQMDNLSPEERRLLKDEVVWEETLKADYEKGWQEGLREGRMEGREEGLQEGHEAGLRQGQEQIALSLLKEGVDIDLITRVTGLNREVIETLS
jgi:hypothetical protein